MTKTTPTSTWRLSVDLDTRPKAVLQAKPLQRRFEKISDAFHAEQASFRDKAREKVMKHLAG